MGEVHERPREAPREIRSDAELLRAAQNDPEAFAVFYDRHVRALLAYFYRRTACAEPAADLAAESFAAAFAARWRYRETGAPARAWLFKIAQRQLSRALRRGRVAERARRRLGVERISPDEESIERIEALADLEPVRAAVRDAIGSLSPNLATAVALRIGDDRHTRRSPAAWAAARRRRAHGSPAGCPSSPTGWRFRHE
jgi:DNA-directed RNA polymerase specialized sigma24 family protein